MMSGALIFVALAAAGQTPAAADARIPLAVINVQAGADVAPEAAVTISGLVGAHLDKTGVFNVVTEDDVKQMVSFDQMKTALSCDEQASCLAEIGQALGVPYMLTGTLGKLGSSLALSLVLIDIGASRALKRESATFADMDALLAALPNVVDRAVAELLYKQKGTLMVLCDEEGAVVELDGKAIGTTPLGETEVPSGPHRVTVSKEGFIQHAIDIAVRPREQSLVRASLKPSPEFLAAYQERAGGTRAAAWATGIGAGASALAGAGGIVGFFVHREALRGDKGIGGDSDVTANGAEYATLAAEYYGGIALVVAGAALAGTSAWLFASGDDPARYDGRGSAGGSE